MATPTESGIAKPLARLVIYYVVLAGAVVIIWRFFPELYELLIRSTAEEPATTEDLFAPQVTLEQPGRRTLGTAVAVSGSLAMMLPVAWVYMLTKRLEGYDRSVVQTLIMLPIAIAGVVVIVQNSIALAFSLAGIVAAVRFRNTLKDTKDAVYIFVAIAVGLSAGVRALDVATVVSVLFNVVILGLWITNFGNVYADQRRGATSLTSANGLAGTRTGGDAAALGDPELLQALAPKELDELASRAQRIREHVRASQGLEKKQRPNAVLLVHTTDAETAQSVSEEILEEDAKMWRLVEILPAKDDMVTLEYLLRTRKSVPATTILERLKEEGAPQIVATEFRSLKGLTV